MAQQVKTFLIYSDDLTSISGTHMEDGNQLLVVVAHSHILCMGFELVPSNQSELGYLTGYPLGIQKAGELFNVKENLLHLVFAIINKADCFFKFF